MLQLGLDDSRQLPFPQTERYRSPHSHHIFMTLTSFCSMNCRRRQLTIVASALTYCSAKGTIAHCPDTLPATTGENDGALGRIFGGWRANPNRPKNHPLPPFSTKRARFILVWLRRLHGPKWAVIPSYNAINYLDSSTYGYVLLYSGRALHEAFRSSRRGAC